MEKSKNDYDRDAELISIMQHEVTAWKDGEVLLTEKIAFLMTNFIKKARKNFFGIFNDPKDPVTGRDKIFVPITEWTVETVVKNIDIDTRDIHVSSKNKDYKSAALFRLILRNYLDNMRFGKILNKLIRTLSIDGTAILKAWKEDKKNGGGKTVVVKVVDRLNILTDPSAETLDDSAAIIEKNTLTLPEFQEYEYPNTDMVEGTNTVDRTGFDSVNTKAKSQVPYVDAYERYGYLPKSIVTGNGEDEGYVYALAIVSGLEDENAVVHKVVKVKDHPYQEFKFKDVLNRFDGRGIGEMLFGIQAYINEIVNTRMNTNRIAQMGLWEVRGNITPQQLRELFTTSAIKTNNEGDIQRLETPSIDPSSYTDEQTAMGWAQRATQAQREDEISASKPATNALIEERGASKAYDLTMEGLVLNLSKFLEEKVVPLIQETLTEGEAMRITGDPGELMKIQEPYVRNLVFQKMLDYKEKFGFIPLNREQIDQQIGELNAQLSESGSNRFIEYAKEAFNTEYSINIEPRDEQINRSVMANQLVQVIGVLAGAGVDTRGPVRELFDSMGLDADKLTADMQPPQQQTDQTQQPQQQEQLPMPASNIPNAQGV